ncbi:MAG: hypothetical protein JXB88_24890 [Spirochaetales bacterium]|nr:hypothetical protein [Spirochaetales bacterium]
MNKKSAITAFLMVCILVLTITTCNLLNKEMKLILPSYLYDGDADTSKKNGIIQLYDYMGSELIVELTIVPADADNPENQNNDSDDLSEYLLIPPSATIAADQLFVEFQCVALDTVMDPPGYKDVSVKATALHFNDAVDTVRIHDVATGPTPDPTDDPTATPEDSPSPTPE